MFEVMGRIPLNCAEKQSANPSLRAGTLRLNQADYGEKQL